MSKFYFTMVVYVDDDANLERNVRSIFKVSPDIRKQVKLVVVDPICNEETRAVINKWEKNLEDRQLVYIQAPGESLAEGYNRAVPEVRGTYVNFSLASTWFDDGALDGVKYIAEKREKPKMISLVPWTVNEKGEYVQYQMSPECTDSVFENIRFYKETHKLQLFFHAYFIRTFLVNGENNKVYFRPELLGDAVMEVLMELLAEWRGYVYLQTFKFHYTLQLEDNTSAFLEQHYEWWYNDSFKNWMLPFAEKWTEKSFPMEEAIRVALLYLVFVRYNCNYNDRNKGVLSGEKLNEFVELTGKILQYIDNDIIYGKPKTQTFLIFRSMRMLFLRIKAEQANCVAEVASMGGELYSWIHEKENDATGKGLPQFGDFSAQGRELACNYSLFSVNRSEGNIPDLKLALSNTSLNRLTEINKEHVILSIINYRDGMLEMDGIFSGGNFLEKDNVRLKLIKDEIVYPVEHTEVYGLNKVFGITYNKKYWFHVSVPGTSVMRKSDMQFFCEINGEDYLLEIRTNSVYSHVRADVKGHYWRYNNDYILDIVDKNKLRITQVTIDALVDKEKAYRAELQKLVKAGDYYAKMALELRKMYFEAKQNESDSRIWITFDKLYKAGDNGEYIYHYIADNHKDIDMRYMIKDDSLDYERMAENGDNLLIWGTDEARLSTLMAEVILTTHTNVASYTGFDKELVPYICDLFNATIVCIQHGLTVQDIAQYQNRVFDNLELYLCASPNEVRNLSRPIYGYRDLETLVLAGMARYDGLVNNDKKQILITPTWRRNIANSDVAHFKKGHNDFFKNSEYYRIYNSLINDPKLIECAKKTGYKLIYLLHPAASSQIDDFDRNDFVEIIAAAGDMNYEKILTESSLMVTDYSGIQFDFAYMRKPILYYHPSTIPPHYNESEAYVYSRDAFGPLIDNHEELVDELCKYMKNKCKTEDQFIERANKFFAFDDLNNCKRIYEATREYADKNCTFNKNLMWDLRLAE